MNNQKPIYDIIGIGVGPFNLGLAALIQPIKEIKSLFIDMNENFDWHPGILLPDATLQVPFMADMTTLVDPTSKFTFLNYLKEHNRLYKFYFYENFFILRQEYNHYCQWVAKNLQNILFKTKVIKIELCKTSEPLYKLDILNTSDNTTQSLYTKHISLGVGTIPYIPNDLYIPNNPLVQHSSNFVNQQPHLDNANTICVIGSGQSAGEIILTLLKQQSQHQRKLYWITSSKGFFPMEYSKLGLEHFSPDYMNHFYNLTSAVRDRTIRTQDMMYKGISKQTIAEIFDELYKITIANQEQPLTMLANTRLNHIQTPQEHKFLLELTNLQSKTNLTIAADAITLATGYKTSRLSFLDSLNTQLVQEDNQAYALNQDFSIKTTTPQVNKIFMQNNSLFSHGVGSPDLGLGAYRNATIINSIMGQEIYPISKKTIFQDFDCNNLRTTYASN